MCVNHCMGALFVVNNCTHHNADDVLLTDSLHSNAMSTVSDGKLYSSPSAACLSLTLAK